MKGVVLYFLQPPTRTEVALSRANRCIASLIETAVSYLKLAACRIIAFDCISCFVIVLVLCWQSDPEHLPLSHSVL